MGTIALGSPWLIQIIDCVSFKFFVRGLMMALILWIPNLTFISCAFAGVIENNEKAQRSSVSETLDILG